MTSPDALVFKGMQPPEPLTEREKFIYEAGEIHGQSKYRDWLLTKVDELPHQFNQYEEATVVLRAVIGLIE
jgi:hypothetical protein